MGEDPLFERPPAPGSAGETRIVGPTSPCWITKEATFTDPITSETYDRYRIPVGYARGQHTPSGPVAIAEAYFNDDADACGAQDLADTGDTGFAVDNDFGIEVYLTSAWAIDSEAYMTNNTFRFELFVREYKDCENDPPTVANCAVLDPGGEFGAFATSTSHCAWDTVRFQPWQEGVDWPLPPGIPSDAMWAPPDVDCIRPEVYFGPDSVSPRRLGEFCYYYVVRVYGCSSSTECTQVAADTGCFLLNWVE